MLVLLYPQTVWKGPGDDYGDHEQSVSTSPWFERTSNAVARSHRRHFPSLPAVAKSVPEIVGDFYGSSLDSMLHKKHKKGFPRLISETLRKLVK